MKRFIITSICTLVLSLIGALGVNRDASILGNTLKANSSTTKVEQNVSNTEDQNLPADKNASVTATTPSAYDTDQAQATPSQISKEDAGEADGNNNGSLINTVYSAPVQTADNSQNLDAVRTDITSVPESNVQAMPVSYTTTQANASIADLMKNIRSYNTNGSNVIVYKNVNLSNCKSKKDVINKLNKNGYKISRSNLNYIMNLIRNYQSVNGGSNTNVPTQGPAPTKAPVITTTPAPTKAPTPAPTKAPTPAPTKAPTPTPAPSNNSGLSNYASQVLQLVNQERAKAGLSAYTTNTSITAAANLRAKEIVQSFSHTRPNGTSFYTALQQYNVSYSAAGENIAYGQRTPQEVVTAWMNSPGHRANILNSRFSKIGIGVYQVNGTYYWSQEFTN